MVIEREKETKALVVLFLMTAPMLNDNTGNIGPVEEQNQKQELSN